MDRLLTLPQDQSHYLAQVMRLTEGDVLTVFNGKDGEWEGRITQLAKKQVTITLLRQLREQALEPDVWLAFAPIKGDRVPFIIEKATELGVSAFLPTLTRRTVISRVNTEKLWLTAKEAAEQSERLTVPQIREMQTLPELLAHWPEERLLIIADETGSGQPIAKILSALPKQPYALLIGPEGGFTPEELTMLHAKPYVRAVGLGPRILRADTAALAGLSCIFALRGDWEQPPRFNHA